MERKRLITRIAFLGLLFVLLWAANPDSIAAAPASHPEVKINILAAGMGGEGYIMSFALADIVNKTHPWLRLRGMETTGIAENLKSLAKEPERRPNTIIFASLAAYHQAKIGAPPYGVPYDSVRLIALFSASRCFAATVNPNLKTWKDLVGKKVGIFPKGSSGIIEWESMLKYGYGINPKEIDWMYLPPGPGIDALSDGRLAATWAQVGPPPLNAPQSALQALLTTRDVYFVGFSEAAAKEARKNSGYPTYVAEVPAGTYTPKQAKIFGHLQFMSWWADLAMDKEIVYEVTKTIYENVDKFANYHTLGKSVTKAGLAQIGVEGIFHPGALKLYKEKALKIGLE